MATILVVEDDADIRNNLGRLLRLEGHEVAIAGDGREGLEQALGRPPELVITDINMPGMDGFALVEALRAAPALATTPILMLTALDDRASMRRGMRAGADDYLAKPFTRVELLDALEGLLRKGGRIAHSIAAAVRSREDDLRLAFTEQLEGGEGRSLGPQPPAGAVADQVVQATVLFSDIRNFTALAERLDSGEVAQLLTAYFERSARPLLAHGGRHLRFMGDGLMAVFVDAPGEPPVAAARRALAAALALALVAHEFRAWLAGRFGARGLPPLAIGAGLHAGAVSICRLDGTQLHEATPVGAAVDTAARLQSASRELGWTVAASAAVLEAAGAGVQTGGITSLDLGGGDGWVEVAEVVGLEANAADLRHGMAGGDRAQDIRRAVEVNSEITARAVKGALRHKLSGLKDHRFGTGERPPRLKGYRLTRKLAAGGMTEVYLAEREADGLPVVLKVLVAADQGGSSEHLARFIQEYALLSRIADPHVIRIYDQGFGDDHAYIAMEYFERGDLRAELRAGMSRERALDVLAQVARALAVVHAHGIIHRDLKPENLMVRPDGSVALADFGVAKSLLREEQLALTQTRHGDVVGTPFYLSPEQAGGDRITPASDLYSLGVMLYEMLTGSRPFQGDSLELLLSRHLTAPTPRLPLEFEGLQPVLDRLMAKQPQDRYPSAQALLDDLAQRPLLRTLAGPRAA